MSGYYLMKDSSLNRGCGFTEEERSSKKVRGLMPARCVTLDEQVNGVMARLKAIKVPLEKYIYLVNLQDSNETLFYKSSKF